LFEQAVAIRREERPLDNGRVAVALANLARALTDAGHLISAEAYLDQAVTLSESARGTRATETADILVQFGSFALDAKSDPARASQLFGRALNIYRSAIGNQNLQVAATLNGLADAAVWMNDYPLAEHYQREALSIFQETVSRNHPDNAVALATLAPYSRSAEIHRGRAGAERSAADRKHGIRRRQSSNRGHSSRFRHLYDRKGDTPRAIAATLSALKITRERRSLSYYTVGYYLDALANLYLKMDDLPTAEADARQALAVYAQALPPQHLYVASTHQVLGEVLLREAR